MDVSGIAAIVTGGASGLGEATARLLTEKGALVAIFDLNEDKGNQVAGDIGGDIRRHFQAQILNHEKHTKRN